MADGFQLRAGSPVSRALEMSSAVMQDGIQQAYDDKSKIDKLDNPENAPEQSNAQKNLHDYDYKKETEINEKNTSTQAEYKSETPFYKCVTNPLIFFLEDQPTKSNDILEDIFSELTSDNGEIKKRIGNIPSVLQGCGRGLKGTIDHIDNLIQFENYNPDQNEISKLIPSHLHDIDSTAGLSIIGHSLGAYVSILESTHLKHLATRVVTDVSLWVSKIFRYSESASHFHEEEKEGVVKICQLALHKKFPKYSTDGYEALYPRPPVVYVSSSAKHNLGQHICHQIGLPLSSLCSVPCRLGRMDVVALKKLIEDDIAAGRTPTIIVAYAGTPLLGRCDKLNELHEMARQYDIWLHLEGSSLSMLSFPSVPSHLATASLCNSMTFNMAAWLALPSLPFVTLFRSPDIVLTRLVGLSTFNVRYKLNCISLWLCILSLGYYRTVARLQFHTHLAVIIYEKLKTIQLDNELVILDMESPCVVFKYQMKSDSSKKSTADDAESSPARHPFGPRDAYCDTLNIWLTDMLKNTVPEVHVSVVEVEGVGMCIRYAPLETSVAVNSWSLLDVTRDDIEQFLDSLEQHVKIVDATVTMRPLFHDIVNEQDDLQLVHLQTWAGLGAVRYLPDSSLVNRDDESEEALNEINSLNQRIVQQLKSSDSAFSLGVTESGVFCIRFGLVTQDTDLEELIAVVLGSGKQVEESSKYLETMADVVKKGIEKAAEDLEKENRDKLIQEGLLRQVPLVGSLWNWWSPPPKDTIKGRSFNLASGKIASTEETYKSCMQVLESPATLENAQPPREVPLKFNLKRFKKPKEASKETPTAPGPGSPSLSVENGPTKPVDDNSSNNNKLEDAAAVADTAADDSSKETPASQVKVGEVINPVADDASKNGSGDGAAAVVVK